MAEGETRKRKHGEDGEKLGGGNGGGTVNRHPVLQYGPIDTRGKKEETVDMAAAAEGEPAKKKKSGKIKRRGKKKGKRKKPDREMESDREATSNVMDTSN